MAVCVCVTYDSKLLLFVEDLLVELGQFVNVLELLKLLEYVGYVLQPYCLLLYTLQKLCHVRACRRYSDAGRKQQLNE